VPGFRILYSGQYQQLPSESAPFSPPGSPQSDCMERTIFQRRAATSMLPRQIPPTVTAAKCRLSHKLVFSIRTQNSLKTNGKPPRVLGGPEPQAFDAASTVHESPSILYHSFRGLRKYCHRSPEIIENTRPVSQVPGEPRIPTP